MPHECDQRHTESSDFFSEVAHHDRGPRSLPEGGELCGYCSDVREVEGIPIVTIAGISIAVPHEIADKAKNGIGKRVGILRADGRYWIKSSPNS